MRRQITTNDVWLQYHYCHFWTSEKGKKGQSYKFNIQINVSLVKNTGNETCKS